MRDVIRYCAEHFAEELSLSSLEETLHLNRHLVSHLFNKEFGMGFNEYINSLRVSEACRLLLQSQESVAHISEAVGFHTLRTFNRAFFKQTGVSPSEYRRSKGARAQIRHFVNTDTTSRIIEFADKLIKR